MHAVLICGVKATHDSAVALMEDSRLLFSVEIEKLANNDRYSRLGDLSRVETILGDFGFDVSDIDQFVVDGWVGSTQGRVSVRMNGDPAELVLAPYRERSQEEDLFTPTHSGVLSFGSAEVPYSSYFHVSGHVASAYFSSPFAAQRESSYVLVWDGGMFPRLYHMDCSMRRVENVGAIFPLVGHVYATAGHHFGPFKKPSWSYIADDLSTAGKMMAYIALGEPRSEIIQVVSRAYYSLFESDSDASRSYRDEIGGWGTEFEPSMAYLHDFYQEIEFELGRMRASDEDALASIHEFLENLLVSRTVDAVSRHGERGRKNICFTGGCALNIKWNSGLRQSGAFSGVWVPPFPNDSGAAIGAACCHRWGAREFDGLEWHVRSGPALLPVASVPEEWTMQKCSVGELAALLHETGRPVVVLNGRAELGPRALGGRSIVAAPTDASTKTELNGLKERESYRPVAPICIEERAPEIFDPGTPDPYMLFDHDVRGSWINEIPAVVHLDNSARLQTVGIDDDPCLYRLLVEYEKLSGVPVLCNTSANYNGRGFFPDVRSAMEWNRIPYIWSEGFLFSRVIDES